LTADDLSVAQAFANIATISILQARATHDARTVIDQLQRALDTRVVIEQAKGFVAQHANVSLDESFARIRRYARNNNLRLSNVARDIVANVLDPELLINT
jgi:AmiR/NasT family two-component response regulator